MLLVSLVVLFITFFIYIHCNDIRESIIKSYVILFFLIVISTEIASLSNAITYHVIYLSWFSVACIFFVLILFRIKSTKIIDLIKKNQLNLQIHGFQEWTFIAIIGTILTITLFISLLSPPNNYDSMTYHMVRVSEWIQNQNVSFYPTANSRQNYLSPLAEFAILHAQLLSKSDRFANIVQWYSFLNAIFFATLIGKEIQLSRYMQIFSGLMVATIPMAILQSSSTQNDLVSGTFCLGFAYFLLRLVKTLSFHDTLFCALSLGSALLTKGTSYIYCCAIGLAIGIAPLFFSLKLGKEYTLFRRFTIIILFGLLINAGFYARNFNLYDNPLGPPNGVLNEKFSSAILLSNIVRNATLHLGMPSNKINSFVTREIRTLLGEQSDNPKSTFLETKFAIPFSLHEDTAGNPLHFLLIVIALLIFPLLKISKAETSVYNYVTALILSVILFCVLLKWQPWSSRLHTTIFMLAAPFVAFVLEKIGTFNKKYSFYLSILLFIYGIPFLLVNQSRPLISPFKIVSLVYPADNQLVEKFKLKYDISILKTDRKKLYFANRPDSYADYTDAIRVAMNEGTNKIGLYLGGDDWEYPFWVFADSHAIKADHQFNHVGVVDISNTIEKQSMPAPVVVATKPIDDNLIAGKEYINIFDSQHVQVFKLKNGT
jgi:hypothetical protein